MENNNEQKECKCMCWGHHEGCKKHVVLRWILGIAILVFVFSMGVKLGEFKGWMKYGTDNFGGYGRGFNEVRMIRGGYDNSYGYGMMQNGRGVNKQIPQQEIQQPVTEQKTQ